LVKTKRNTFVFHIYFTLLFLPFGKNQKEKKSKGKRKMRKSKAKKKAKKCLLAFWFLPKGKQKNLLRLHKGKKK